MKLRHVIGLLSLNLILLGMGFWQLERAKLKQQILDLEAKARSMTIIDCQKLEFPQAWQKCKISGKRRKELFYLDNQFRGHELGYDVLGVIQLHSGQVLLVDLGWQALGESRQTLVTPKIPEYTMWMGQVYYPRQGKIKFGDLLDHQTGQTYVIERLDLSGIASLLHQPVLPWVLRMSLHQPTGLKQEWALVAVAPRRHYAYALQWFTMAVLVFGILIWRIISECKRKT